MYGVKVLFESKDDATEFADSVEKLIDADLTPEQYGSVVDGLAEIIEAEAYSVGAVQELL